MANMHTVSPAFCFNIWDLSLLVVHSIKTEEAICFNITVLITNSKGECFSENGSYEIFLTSSKKQFQSCMKGAL